MIFKSELVKKVLSGEKTQTRRPVQSLWADGELYEEIPCRYKPGHTYAVQPGRGKKSIARIEVLSVRRERWRDISERDAIAEGFPPAYVGAGIYPEIGPSAGQRFLGYVRRLYSDLDLEAECWVIEFRLAAATEAEERHE